MVIPKSVRALLLLSAVVLLFVVYQPGLNGSFLLDDSRNIELNEKIHIDAVNVKSLQQAWNGGVVGGLGRPLSMLTFALTHYLSGPEAFGYKLGNACLHILNMLIAMGLVGAVLKRWLYRETTDADSNLGAIWLLALGISLVWALHPLQVSTVLYAVQRMALLAAFFSLSGLWLYIVWRQSLGRPGWRRWGLPPMILLMLILGVLSKENGVLLLAYIGVAELFVCADLTKSSMERRYRQLFVCAVVVAVIAALSYIHFFQDWFAVGYEKRNFTLTERLYTEARMMFTYMTWIILPSIEQYGLFHDDIVISSGLLAPKTTIISILGLMVLVAIAILTRRKLPWLGFGIGFFLLGHSIESTIVPLELVFEHRNYLPSLGLILIAVMAGRWLTIKLKLRKRVYITAGLSVSLFLLSMTLMRSLEWSSYYGQVLASVERHPNSARTQWAMGIWYLQTHSGELALGIDDSTLYNKGVEHALLSVNVGKKEYASSYFGLVLFHYKHNRPVPVEWLTELGERLKNNVYHVETDSYFKKLIECYQSDRCYAEADEVEYLFQQVLKNSKVTPRTRANFLSGYSAFKNHQRDYVSSAAALAESMKLVPTQRGYRNLVILYLELKDKASAEKSFAILKSMSGPLDTEENGRIEVYVNQCCDIPLP